jgi:hypothetical protein
MLLGLVVILGLVGSASAGSTWTGAVDNDWLEPGNWTDGPAPPIDEEVSIIIGNGDPDGPVVAAPGAVAGKGYVGFGYTGRGPGVLFVEPGGSIDWGPAVGPGWVGVGSEWGLGVNGDGIVNMRGGTWTSGELRLGNKGTAHGQVNMTGGYMDVESLQSSRCRLGGTLAAPAMCKSTAGNCSSARPACTAGFPTRNRHTHAAA